MKSNLVKSGLIYLIIGLLFLSVSMEMIKFKPCIQTGEYCLDNADCCSKSCLHGRYRGISYCISLKRKKNIPSSPAVKNYTAPCLQNHRTCSLRSECCSKTCFKIPGKSKGICV
ncbi:uncharacterized protein LOC130666049 [Microplitis mediator]|uniref:uncharacterized protein LOC130666049 n=1 Tax=Microplitis mediator TaxID=375433 RepID=UPI002556984F|nr:uncharacterized protein LOC130666049 [Microplitis mediator]